MRRSMMDMFGHGLGSHHSAHPPKELPKFDKDVTTARNHMSNLVTQFEVNDTKAEIWPGCLYISLSKYPDTVNKLKELPPQSDLTNETDADTARITDQSCRSNW